MMTSRKINLYNIFKIRKLDTFFLLLNICKFSKFQNFKLKLAKLT